jgi:hypothetical protein
MRHSHRAILVLASALLSSGALASLAAGAASAQAHPAARPADIIANIPGSCPSGSLCTYQNKNFNEDAAGAHWNFSYNGYQHNSWIWVGGAANDQITSIVSYRALDSAVAKDNPSSGDAGCYEIPGNNNQKDDTNGSADLSGIKWNDFTNVNDSISSVMLRSSGASGCPGLGS